MGTEVRWSSLTQPSWPRDLVSWAVGVAVGRFDLRLATGDAAVV